MFTLPEAARVPMPLSIETEAALIVDQLRVVESPALIADGFAVKLAIAGAGVPLDERVTVNMFDSPGKSPVTVPLMVLPLTVAVTLCFF